MLFDFGITLSDLLTSPPRIDEGTDYVVPVSRGAISRYFNALREIPSSEDFLDSGENTRNPQSFETLLLDEI